MSPFRAPESHLPYRPDIDGLRAVAVLAVLGFHAFPHLFPGGFIGVDVFFVISGYLISTILLVDLERGTFRFANFYARRVRRIFPALLLVLAACFTFGWVALLADEFKQLGKHIAAAAGFVSNLVLWNESGYFDNAADTKPLLHLWSLGIEEQFYLAWPVLLWLGVKLRGRGLMLMLLVAGISMTLNLLGIGHDATATFYSPQTRFWELASGGLLAAVALRRAAGSAAGTALHAGTVPVGAPRRGLTDTAGALLAGLAGPALLAAGFWWIDSGSAFPGLWAVLPVAGAVLVIAAGPGAPANRLLAHPLGVWIGTISYPLYLWHWPLLAFTRIVQTETPSPVLRMAALLLAVPLAWLTHRLLERPLRRAGKGGRKVAALLGLMVIVGYCGYNVYLRDGVPRRPHATLSAFEGDIGQLQYHRYTAEHYFPCLPAVLADDALRWEGFTRCAQSQASAAVEFALIGDSHAEHLFPGLAAALPGRNVAFYIRDSPPFLGNPDFDSVFATVLASQSVRTVLLALHWAGRINQRVPVGSTTEAELLKVIDALGAAGKSVVLVDDLPDFPFGPERCKGRRFLTGTPTTCEIPAAELRSQRAFYMPVLERVLAARPAIRLLSLPGYVCSAASCSMTHAGTILYRDNNHLNLDGSLLIGRALVHDHPEIFR